MANEPMYLYSKENIDQSRAWSKLVRLVTVPIRLASVQMKPISTIHVHKCAVHTLQYVKGQSVLILYKLKQCTTYVV